MLSKQEPQRRPLRVLHVYRTYYPDPPGGLQEVIRQICLNTRPFGVESRVFTLSANPRPAVVQREEGDVHRVRLHLSVASADFSFAAPAGFRPLAQWADVIHYHFPWPFADILHLMSRVSKPAVLTYHSDIVRQKRFLWLYRPLMNRFLSQMERIVATSPNYAQSSATLSQYASKVRVIAIGLDQASYPPPSPIDVSSMVRRVGEGFFLFVGVLRYYKGLHVLLEAARETGCRIVIAGTGPREKQLTHQARRLAVHNVSFLGRVTDAERAALLQLSKAIVFPSCERSEAFGVTLVEGAMAGKPLISTALGTGTTFVNKDGETGIVVAPNDSAGLGRAMQRLDSDPALAERLGRGARARYERLFQGRQMGLEYADLYSEVAAQHSASRG